MTALLSEALKNPDGVTAVSVPFRRYRFVFRVTAEADFPEYAGSMIRGAFGRALRRTSCMTHQKDCKSCPLYRTCPYTTVFETPAPTEHELQKFSQIPNAYVIEPPQWGRHLYAVGEELIFSIVLFGRARESLALIIYAMQKAFWGHVGQGKADLESVSTVGPDGDTVIYSPQQTEIAEHEADTVMAVPGDGQLHLAVQTPLRLQQNGKVLGAGDITAERLLVTAMRRLALLCEFQCRSRLDLDFHALAESAKAVSGETDLTWRNWTRFSSRQQQLMTLGGLTGTVTLNGVPPFYRIVLAASELMHIGKNATFGLGRIKLF